MKIKSIPAQLTFASLAFVLGVSQALAGERPPADAKPLSEIVAGLEQQGYSPITEISMDHGVWEVEAYNKENLARELRVDPMSGAVTSDREDD